MKTIAVYGSLKEGRHNNPMLGKSELLGKTKLTGDLYSMGTYPALLDEGLDTHDAEVYTVDEEVYLNVMGMELGAGYVEKVVDVEVGGETVKAIVYFAGNYLKEHCKKFREKLDSY